MEIDIPCFIMLCSNETERECLERGLFGDREYNFRRLSSIKKGDIGFLLNVSRKELLGIFVAEGPAQLNIVPEAWGGGFPAQVKVKLIGKLQRVEGAINKLKNIIPLNTRKGHWVPFHFSYGPEITEKILSLFEIPEELLVEQHREIGIFPEPTLEDVAGLDEVKKFIYKRIIAPFEDEETAYMLKLRIGGGLLLFGPPGTGKTLVAMAIANSIQAKFIDISPSVIIGYPGEAEKRLENIFSALEKEPRAVLFFDEAEWILCKRESQASSVMQRITPLILAQLSKIFKEKTKPIIIIAATNKPEMIDPAFLRPGRFDKIFYVGLPDKNTIKEIIKIQLRGRKHKLNDNEITELSEKLEGYSGADIEYIIDEAAFLASERKDKDKEVAIIKEDIIKVIEKTFPSVKPEDVKKLEEWAKKIGIKIS